VPIQRTIRARVVDALRAPEITRPHVIVSHSLGTVIAYDCLKRVADCAPVDGLITLGSPLGLDEIQDRLRPEWCREQGFPQKVEGGWVNVSDRLDPVCGFCPSLAGDFRRGDAMCIDDIAVENDGRWRHSATKYLRQPAFRQALWRLLQP
jgi:pimeloyl-ACP methyl ester carboxylesterase